jgi:hypothetical protein
MGEGNENSVSSSPWNFNSSFTCRKILRHGTFRLYFPSERKVCCEFFFALKNPSPWPGSNPRPLGPVAITLTTTSPRRQKPAIPSFLPIADTSCVPKCCYQSVYCCLSRYFRALLHEQQQTTSMEVMFENEHTLCA